MNNTTSNEKAITNFTLPELLALAGRKGNGLTNECITADSDSTFQLPYPCRIDAFIVGIGTDGETTVTFNLQDYRIRRNSMFVFSPQSILQTAPGEHFRAHVLIVSRA